MVQIPELYIFHSKVIYYFSVFGSLGYKPIYKWVHLSFAISINTHNENSTFQALVKRKYYEFHLFVMYSYCKEQRFSRLLTLSIITHCKTEMHPLICFFQLSYLLTMKINILPSQSAVLNSKSSIRYKIYQDKNQDELAMTGASSSIKSIKCCHPSKRMYLVRERIS